MEVRHEPFVVLSCVSLQFSFTAAMMTSDEFFSVNEFLIFRARVVCLQL